MLTGRVASVVQHILFLAGTVFLFLGTPGYHAARSLRDLWNMGHLFLFILFILILYTDWEWFRNGMGISRCLAALALAAIFGFGTEVIQSFIGRQFDWFDLARDLAGASAGLLLLPGAGRGGSKWKKRIRIAVLVIIIVTVSIPLLFSLADELNARTQFPLLSGFETALEIDRWRADGSISRSDTVSMSGEYSLRGEFTTRQYSRITMRYSLGDWRGYDYLVFHIFNPDTIGLNLILRVHDHAHELDGSAYTDRFHRKLSLEKGWNSFRIPVNEIRKAPAGRDIDLESIAQISFFTVALPEPRYIYLDDIVLNKR